MSNTTATAAATPMSSANSSSIADQVAYKSNVSAQAFFASLAFSAVLFCVQVVLFILIKSKLPRIYSPRSFLVSARQRVSAPAAGIWRWIVPVVSTSNSEFIEKCGLDAYFFLRYLRMLLKIFLPSAFIILPILIPVNYAGGKGDSFAVGIYTLQKGWSNQTGLNQFAWGNVRPTNTNRYWAHCILAILVIVYCCFVFFDELRGYVRLRQAYLTSPQHRIRASATTVLVSAIPRKWCTAQALEGLYDVFPGGIRNIWINRNFDELNEKVQVRDDITQRLEGALTELVRKAKKSHLKELEKEAKKAGQKKSKREKKDERKEEDKKAEAMAATEGISTGNPHQVRHTVDEALYEQSSSSAQRSSSHSPERKGPILPVNIPGLGRGLEAVESGITNIGKSVFGGLKTVGRGVDNAISTTQGFETSREDLTRTANAPGETGSLRHTSSEPHSEVSLDRARAPAAPASIPQLDGTVSSVTVDPDVELETSRHSNPAHDNLHQNNPTVGAEDVAKHTTGESRPTSNDSHKVNTVPLHGKTKYAFWRQQRNALQVPDPFPHGFTGEEPADPKSSAKSWWQFWKKSNESEQKEEYAPAYDDDYDPNDDNPLWQRYLKIEDRETMRLPIFGISWLSWIPFVGQKVDTIDHCRKELARLNLEIEQDQQEPEKYPLMNSAFIQFNHQVAAHMACQAVSHHIPMQMNPRTVEISPNDVLWDNMSIRWWERWLRTFGVIVLVIGLIIAFATPVAFTGVLSNVDALSAKYDWLIWLRNLPDTVKSIIQGILPPSLLALMLILAPIVLRLLAKQQGVATGTAAELSVQWAYFAFLFLQVFLIVTVSTAITQVIQQVTSDPSNVTKWATILATYIPTAANYFFNYMILQALSTSASVLVQLFPLLIWFIWGPLRDNTARQKWRRQMQLPDIQWGSFFPVYTNFACIGLVYCCVAPLMLVFLIITFSFFWFVYRFQTLYVTKFTEDTGGLLFPQAINQLFVGLYFMEVVLIGLFILVKEVNLGTGDPVGTPCQGQAITMVVVLICTIVYQILLNHAFGQLFRYLPITLEDDAVIRDQEFANLQDKKFRLTDNEQVGDDINDILEERERRSNEEDRKAEAMEQRDIQRRKSRRIKLTAPVTEAMGAVGGAVSNLIPGSWADRSRARQRPQETSNWVHDNSARPAVDVNAGPETLIHQHRLRTAHRRHDVEANANAKIAEALFAGINDEIEDLTPEERDLLVRRAFQHAALRARRPVVWIPRDDLGVSDDEIKRTKGLSKYIWISNEHTGLDSKVRVVYHKSPPDFSELDLITL